MNRLLSTIVLMGALSLSACTFKKDALGTEKKSYQISSCACG
ncbi:hypothetical protein [Bdellovibrio bacteriovorus]